MPAKILNLPRPRRRRRSDAPCLPLGAPVAIFRPVDRAGHINRLAHGLAGQSRQDVRAKLSAEALDQYHRLLDLGVDDEVAVGLVMDFLKEIEKRLIADPRWRVRA